MRNVTYEFEGEQKSMAQIRLAVPALGPSTIRAHLAAGRTTREAMLTFNASAASVRSGRRMAKKVRRGEAGLKPLNFNRKTQPPPSS